MLEGGLRDEHRQRGLAGAGVAVEPEAAAAVDLLVDLRRSTPGPGAPRRGRSRSPGGGRRRRPGTWPGSPRRRRAGARGRSCARGTRRGARRPRGRGSSRSRRRPPAGRRPGSLPARRRPRSGLLAPVSSSSGGRPLPGAVPAAQAEVLHRRPLAGGLLDGLAVLVGAVGELRIVAEEGELDGPDRPVAVLGDDQLGDAGLLGLVAVVVLVAVEEADQVGVLLDRARLAQVARGSGACRGAARARARAARCRSRAPRARGRGS